MEWKEIHEEESQGFKCLSSIGTSYVQAVHVKAFPNGCHVGKETGLQHISNTKEFLPADLLKSLVPTFKNYDSLSSGGKKVVKMNRTTVPPKRRPECVWHYPLARTKFKHLTDNPPCTCGAGSEISFLADYSAEGKDVSHGRCMDDTVTNGLSNVGPTVPDTLIPAEFHIVKSKGVMGLEVQDDKYTTLTKAHDCHDTVFPSLKPAGRQEAVQLLHTMDAMLKRAGVDDDDAASAGDSELDFEARKDGSSQIHALLKLIQDEQKIYNIVFNEIIRQVSVDCVERGAVLAKLRKRYAALLEKVPRRVKCLHEEVLAQRALDRRLTEELTRFKCAVASLTSELHEVQEHDRGVTKQALETQSELDQALKESDKNASLLAEYHDLYELQRRRLDSQIAKLIEERDLWAGCAYVLSTKVADKHDLANAKRLNLCERTWYKLANQFSIFLTDHDSKEIQKLVQLFQSWREVVETFDKKILDVEESSCRRIKAVRIALSGWGTEFQRVVGSDEGTVVPLQDEAVARLVEVCKSWEDVLNAEMERFTGETLLACEDGIIEMTKCVDLWNDVATFLFLRHPGADGGQHEQHIALLELNRLVESLHCEYRMRSSGENGVARCITYLVNSMDTWVNKLNESTNGGDKLFDSEWIQLSDYIQVQWSDTLLEVILLLSCGQEPSKDSDGLAPASSQSALQPSKRLNPEDVFELAEKWVDETTKCIDNDDCNLLDQVTNAHANLVRWMITVLFRLAPDMPSHSSPGYDEGVSGQSHVGVGSSILAEATTEAIASRAQVLRSWLEALTGRIVSAVKDLIASDGDSSECVAGVSAQQRRRDLDKIKTECNGWIHMSSLLTSSLTAGPSSSESKISSAERKTAQKHRGSPDVIGIADTVDGEIPRPGSESSLPSCRTGTLHTYVIASDDGVEVADVRCLAKRQTQISIENVDEAFSVAEGLAADLTPLKSLRTLQVQLMRSEERAQAAEDRAYQAESALKEASERLRALELTAAAKKREQMKSSS